MYAKHPGDLNRGLRTGSDMSSVRGKRQNLILELLKSEQMSRPKVMLGRPLTAKVSNGAWFAI